MRRGAPTGSFLWPHDLVEIEGSGSFGYFMSLRGGSYVSIRDLIAAPPKRVELDLARRARICSQLAESFLELHASGFCYQDINFGNIFFEPDSARILICDNDNVNIDGADASIYGTRKFMAPEVVRREKLPSSRTDLYSMAVLFFYTLLGWHPLDGKREHDIALMDAGAENMLYGLEPLFLFDPANDANGPVPGYHDAIVARWRSLPAPLRALFIRAFTRGLHDPSARVLETQWRTALARVPGAVHQCAECGFEHVAELRGGKANAHFGCLACARPMTPPYFLMIGQRSERLAVGDQIGGGLGRVEVHPTRPDVLGLRNLSQGDLARRRAGRHAPPGAARQDGAPAARHSRRFRRQERDRRRRGEAGMSLWRIGGASVRGPAHIRGGKPNQDSIAWMPQAGTGSRIVAAVSDGHGAAPHFRSDLGSAFAVEAASEVLAWDLDESESDEFEGGLVGEIARSWRAKVEAHLAAEPLEAVNGSAYIPYGATLLAAGATEEQLIALQIGDGDLLIGYPDGRIERPLASDEGLVGEQTYSLCLGRCRAAFPARHLLAKRGQAAAGLRHAFDRRRLEILPRRRTPSPARSPRCATSRFENWERTLAALPGWLNDVTTQGSGDDSTLCLALRGAASEEKQGD